MSVEQPKGVGDFNATWPRPTDSPTEGDDHIRLIKVQLNKIFAKFDKPLTMTSDQLNGVISKLKANGVNLEVLSGLLTITPAVSEAGKKAVNAEWVRRFATDLMAGAITHADINAAIAAALTNYYTKAQSDARFAAKNHTHSSGVMIVNQSANMAGTSGAWNVRTMNSVVVNNISGAKLQSGYVVLPAGEYMVDTAQRFDETDHTQCAILIGSTYHYGLGGRARSDHAEEMTLTCYAYASITGNTNVKAMYQIEKSRGDALGDPIGYGHDVFAQMRIVKIG